MESVHTCRTGLQQVALYKVTEVLHCVWFASCVVPDCPVVVSTREPLVWPLISRRRTISTVERDATTEEIKLKPRKEKVSSLERNRQDVRIRRVHSTGFYWRWEGQ
jgi:hypothetical protein